jgi:hypothetical protein
MQHPTCNTISQKIIWEYYQHKSNICLRIKVNFFFFQWFVFLGLFVEPSCKIANFLVAYRLNRKFYYSNEDYDHDKFHLMMNMIVQMHILLGHLIWKKILILYIKLKNNYLDLVLMNVVYRKIFFHLMMYYNVCILLM